MNPYVMRLLGGQREFDSALEYILLDILMELHFLLDLLGRT